MASMYQQIVFIWEYTGEIFCKLNICAIGHRKLEATVACMAYQFLHSQKNC